MTRDKHIVHPGFLFSFGHLASINFFGTDNTFRGIGSWRELLLDVQKGNCDYGVLPIQNSISGTMLEVQDLLVEFGLPIVAEGEHEAKIHLVGLEHANEDITQMSSIVSNNYILEQCSNFLPLNSQLTPLSVSDSATAARFLAERQDVNMVALTSEEAASRYRLRILKHNVQNIEHNITRFYVVSRHREPLGTRLNKCSISIELNNQPKALLAVLKILSDKYCHEHRIQLYDPEQSRY